MSWRRSTPSLRTPYQDVGNLGDYRLKKAMLLSPRHQCTGSSHFLLSQECMPKPIQRSTLSSSQKDSGAISSSTRKAESSPERPSKKVPKEHSLILSSSPSTSFTLTQ